METYTTFFEKNKKKFQLGHHSGSGSALTSHAGSGSALKPMRIRNASEQSCENYVGGDTPVPVTESEAKLYYGISIRRK